MVIPVITVSEEKLRVFYFTSHSIESVHKHIISSNFKDNPALIMHILVVMSVQVTNSLESGARTCVFSTRGGAKCIRTPTCVIMTRGLTVPAITADILKKFPLDNSFICVPISDMIHDVPFDVLKEKNISLSKWMNLCDIPLVISAFDPSDEVSHVGSTKKQVSFTTSHGRKKLSVKEIVDTSLKSEAEIVVFPFESLENLDGRFRKQIMKTYERNISWLKGCSQLSGTSVCHSPSPASHDSHFFSQNFYPIVYNPHISFDFAKKLNKQSTDILQSLETYGTVSSCSPRGEGLRFHLPRLGSIEEILQSVSSGYDIFFSSYPFDMSSLGQCIAPSLEGNSPLNLWSDGYEKDFAGMCEDKDCPTCSLHSRSYIHHLLRTHEMLADILLSQCNLWNFLHFLEKLRKCIEDGSFDEFSSDLIEKFRTRRTTVSMRE